MPARRLPGGLVPPARGLPLAGVVAVVGVLGVFVEIHAARTAPLAPALVGYLIAVLAAALLCWRGRAPLPVAGAVVALCLGYHLLGFPGLAPAAAMFVAPYALADRGPARRRLATVVLVAVVVVIPLLPPHPATFNVGALFGPPLAMLAVGALGDAARTRRLAADQQLVAARRSAADEARRGLVEQRLQIARELHDVLAHTLTVISVQAAVGAEALDDRPEATRTALATVRSAARDATGELRSTLAVLRGGEELDPSPQPGLAELAQLVAATRTALAVELCTDTGPDRLPPETELVIYRIVQEALTNAVRHAGATGAAVAIRRDRDEVTVEISDDGGGVAAGGPPAAGHGLVGMRERARALGGSLDAGPGPERGFRVTARLPVRGAG